MMQHSTPLLQLQQVSFTLQKRCVSILSNIDYTVYPEEMVIIIGSNGSGKSSLLKVIDKRYVPTSGQVLFAGRSINEYKPKVFFHAVKTVTQHIDESLFPSLTVLEHVRLFQAEGGNALTDHELARYLSEFHPALPNKYDQAAQFLSGGEKQALVLALTLLQPPQLLLLDEHTSALDPKTASVIIELTVAMCKRYHVTSLLTTHDLGVARVYGDRILVMSHGTIVKTFDGDEKRNYSEGELLRLCY